MKIRNFLRSYKHAMQLFNYTRDYENNMVVNNAKEYQLRWIVRYHLLIHQGDYSWIDKFGRPKSRKEFISLCNKAIEEITYVWEVLCFYDSTDQYLSNKHFLKHLLFYTQHYPLLFHIMFTPLLRFLRKPVEVRSHL